MQAPREIGTVTHHQREGHILVLLECPETEASADPLSSPIVDLLHVLGWAVTILQPWVSVGLSSSNLHGCASSSHMPWVATHTAVTAGRKSIPGHGPAMASLGSGGLRECCTQEERCLEARQLQGSGQLGCRSDNFKDSGKTNRGVSAARANQQCPRLDGVLSPCQ